MRIKKIIIPFLISLFLFPFFPIQKAKAAGATLFLSPASGDFEVGKTFSVKAMVNSGGGAGINAAEGSIKFDPSIISVTGLSNNGSIFNLWTSNNGQGPGFSNTAGTITFGGGSPSSYKGDAGTIFTITFKALKTGTAEVNFTGGIVLAADGKGTNIFSGFGNAKYVFEEKKVEEKKPEERPKPPVVEEEKPKGILPPIPEISSDSHPKSDIWYSDNDPEFSWKILPDLTNINFEITNKPDSDPKGIDEGVIETKKFENIEDGVWYFHLKYKNKIGWGQTSRYKLMIDASPPEPFGVSLDIGKDPTNPSPKLLFKTVDKTSGIENYTVFIGERKITLKEDQVAAEGGYRLEPLAPGEHQAVVMAADKAGNTASSSITFIIEALRSPIITDIAKIINKKDEFIIRGTSFYPNVTVKIFISKSEKDTIEESVITDENGNWSYFHKGVLDKGNYEVWAKIIDKRGAQSLNSTKHLLTVVSPSIIQLYGLYIILVLLAIIFLLVAYIYYQKGKYALERNRIMGETEEMKSRLSKIFAALREEVDELLEMADKKPGYNESERKIKEKLQESLDISEEFINKEVDDVEKEIKIKKT
jgi:hypothetical protein